jgi:hypothetical protein
MGALADQRGFERVEIDADVKAGPEAAPGAVKDLLGHIGIDRPHFSIQRADLVAFGATELSGTAGLDQRHQVDERELRSSCGCSKPQVCQLSLRRDLVVATEQSEVVGLWLCWT